MPPQNEERLARLKEMLLEHKRRLWTEVREDIFRNTADALNPQFEIPQDLGEQGMLDVLEDLQLIVVDVRKEQLTQLDEAMGKIERGSYGFCDSCGREIDERRLKIMPFATRCIDCQREEETPTYPPEGKI